VVDVVQADADDLPGSQRGVERDVVEWMDGFGRPAGGSFGQQAPGGFVGRGAGTDEGPQIMRQLYAVVCGQRGEVDHQVIDLGTKSGGRVVVAEGHESHGRSSGRKGWTGVGRGGGTR